MDTVVRVAGANQTLVGRRQRAVARGVASAYGVFAERAGGARLWDVEGREYVDFAAGIGTLNLGHTHPEVGRAIAEQADRFLHTCFQVVQYESYVALAERLNRLVPGDFPKKTLLLSTGAEATENAIKIARVATGRPGVVAFRWGYHGRTLLALTMTGKQAPYRQDVRAVGRRTCTTRSIRTRCAAGDAARAGGAARTVRDERRRRSGSPR